MTIGAEADQEDPFGVGGTVVITVPPVSAPGR
jgi:hypothetical protein